MTDPAGHEAIQALAALILSLAGAAILVLAARDRRAAPGRTWPAASSAVMPPRDAAVGILVALSLGAAAIHLAAAPEHIEELGDVGLGFYWAAVFQAVWALAYWTRPSRMVAWIGIAGNAAIVVAWVWTRTIGLPIGPNAGHPEAIGFPDGLATLLQLGLVALLLVRGGVAGRRVPVRIARLAAPNATVISVPLVGVVFLATTLAVSIAAGGDHAVAGDPGHYPAGHLSGRTAP